MKEPGGKTENPPNMLGLGPLTVNGTEDRLRLSSVEARWRMTALTCAFALERVTGIEPRTISLGSGLSCFPDHSICSSAAFTLSASACYRPSQTTPSDATGTLTMASSSRSQVAVPTASTGTRLTRGPPSIDGMRAHVPAGSSAPFW